MNQSSNYRNISLNVQTKIVSVLFFLELLQAIPRCNTHRHILVKFLGIKSLKNRYATSQYIYTEILRIVVGLTNEERIDWAMNGSVDCTKKFLKSSLKPKIFGIIYNCIFRKLVKHMGIKLKKQIRNITVYLY